MQQPTNKACYLVPCDGKEGGQGRGVGITPLGSWLYRPVSLCLVQQHLHCVSKQEPRLRPDRMNLDVQHFLQTKQSGSSCRDSNSANCFHAVAVRVILGICASSGQNFCWLFLRQQSGIRIVCSLADLFSRIVSNTHKIFLIKCCSHPNMFVLKKRHKSLLLGALEWNHFSHLWAVE